MEINEFYNILYNHNKINPLYNHSDMYISELMKRLSIYWFTFRRVHRRRCGGGGNIIARSANINVDPPGVFSPQSLKKFN